MLLLSLLLSCRAPAVPPTPAAEDPADAPAADASEAARLDAVRRELAQGRPTTIVTDASALPEGEREMLRHLLAAADLIEQLYELQRGAFDLRAGLVDEESRALFDRNAGPWCEQPGTRDDPACSALPGGAPQRSGVYPPEVQTPGFCERLEREHPEVMDPFHAAVMGEAVMEGEALVAIPYSQRWPAPMRAVSEELLRAADALGPDAEPALAAYLRAAAQAFLDDSWFEADRAWAAMAQSGSRWYLRVGPDETYFDPCDRHAGFAMTLALVDPGGQAWQARLEPVKQEMEQQFAELAGPRYAAREVRFDLPEFIQIVRNAGDSRNPTGATVGQSLPNWGPVAEAGGRTVAMSNMTTDPATLEVTARVLSSMFCAETMATWSQDPGPFLGTTVLHEAAHNLGPSAGHRVEGQSDEERFGGALSSLMEELKAQTASLYYTGWLAERGLIDAPTLAAMRAADIGWALGKLASGVEGADGSGDPYAQLAAIQVGWLLDEGGMTWRGELAANGQDQGCLVLEPDAGAAIDALARRVLRIKGDMDVDAAERLRADYVSGGAHAAVFDAAAERFAREAGPSYSYVVEGL